MKATVFCLLLASGVGSAYGAGFTAAAIPTRIDVIRSEGFMIDGEFSNPGDCTTGNRIFVKADHPQYKQIYAAALVAFASKQKISAYVHGCEIVIWYSGSATINIVHSYSALGVSE